MNRKLQTLYGKWVSSHRYPQGQDLLILRDVILREKRNAERGIIKVSRDLLREMRAELCYVSKSIKRGACSRYTD